MEKNEQAKESISIQASNTLPSNRKLSSHISPDFQVFSCPPHEETSVLDGALKIKCKNLPMNVKCRICPFQDFDKIALKMKECSLVSFI